LEKLSEKNQVWDFSTHTVYHNADDDDDDDDDV